MPRIVIHAGFHKTGTTTVQNTLRQNADRLHASLNVYLRSDMIALCEAARAASQSPDDVNMGLLKFEAASLAEGWADLDHPILLASEDLAGHMPGRRKLKAYNRTPTVMMAIIEGFEAVLKNPDITVIFTTRAAKPWLSSCYAQHLKATRMTLDEAAYVRDYASSANLAKVVDDLRDQTPYRVHSFAIEDCTGRLGPLEHILPFTGMGPAEVTQLIPSPNANIRPPQAKLDRLLELNRSDLSPEALKVAKRSA